MEVSCLKRQTRPLFKHGLFDSIVLSGRGKPGDPWNSMCFSLWCPDGVQLAKECNFLPFLSRHSNQPQETSYLSHIQEKIIQEMKVNSFRCINPLLFFEMAQHSVRQERKKRARSRLDTHQRGPFRRARWSVTCTSWSELLARVGLSYTHVLV